MTVNLILAHDSDYGIGKNGKLPWPKNSSDMKWFHDNTKDGIVVMGRKTWESLDCKKLPNRINVVISTSEVSGADEIANGNMTEILGHLKFFYGDKKIWIIGGSEIYKQAAPLCDHIYVTEFPGFFDCDTFFYVNRYLEGFTRMATKESDGLKFAIWKRT